MIEEVACRWLVFGIYTLVSYHFLYTIANKLHAHVYIIKHTFSLYAHQQIRSIQG